VTWQTKFFVSKDRQFQAEPRRNKVDAEVKANAVKTTVQQQHCAQQWAWLETQLTLGGGFNKYRPCTEVNEAVGFYKPPCVQKCYVYQRRRRRGTDSSWMWVVAAGASFAFDNKQRR